jgi:hypothetical protein
MNCRPEKMKSIAGFTSWERPQLIYIFKGFCEINKMF